MALEARLIRSFVGEIPHLSRQRAAFIAVVTALALASVVASVARPLVCPVGEGCPSPGFVPALPPPLAVVALWAVMVALALATLRFPATEGRAQLVPRPATVLVAAGLGLGMALVAAHAFLTSPLVSNPPCGTTVQLGGGLGYVYNHCDSPEFVRDAADPSRLLAKRSIRQARPLLIVMAAGVARTVGRAVFATPLPRLYGLATPQDFAYVLLNLAIAAGSIALFLRLVPFGQVPVAAVAAATWIAFDDLMKAFFWTPHTQLFNLLVPVLSIAVARAVLVDPRLRRPLALGGIGLGLGMLALAYGSFIVAGVAAGVAFLLGARRQPAAQMLVGAAALAVGFALPNLLWIVLCLAVAGSFYVDETRKYWEFTWAAHTAKQGVAAFARYWWSVTVLTLQVTLPTAAAAAIATLLAWLAAIATGTRVAAAQVATMVASVLILALSVGFLDLLGFYTSRISYMLVPVLMVILVGLVAALKDRRRHLGQALEGLIVLAAVVNALVVVLRHGPYS